MLLHTNVALVLAENLE